MDNSKPTTMDKEAITKEAEEILSPSFFKSPYGQGFIDGYASHHDKYSALLESKEREIEELKKEVERLSSESIRIPLTDEQMEIVRKQIENGYSIFSFYAEFQGS